MPQVYNNFAVGYREVIFIVPETTYGVIVHPAATHAVQFLTTELNFTQERVNRADKTATRSYRERISHRKSGTWSINLYILPSGTNTVAPDITDALEKGMGTLRAVPNSAVVAGSTTTVINVTGGTGANYQIGDGVGILNAAGDLEISFIKTIATDAITVSPAFTLAPSAAATWYGSTTYKLNNVLGSLTITRVLDNIVTVYPGCFVNDIAFDFPADGEATLTIGGGLKEMWDAGTSTLPGSTLIGATSVTVATGDGDSFEKNTRVLLNAEGANTDEVVLITAVAGDVLTITRAQAGTAASAHGVGTVIGPYEPAMTVAGSPLPGTIGQFVITNPTGSARDIHDTTAQGLTIGNNGNARNTAIGQDSATGFFSTAKRDVAFSVTLWLQKDKIKYFNRAKRFVGQEILMQWGKVVGKAWAAKIPFAEFNIPPISGGGDEEVMIPITGAGLSSASGNDECYVCYM